MQQFIGCDAHKRYSVFVAVNEQGQAGRRCESLMIESYTASFSASFRRGLLSPSRQADTMGGWWTRWSEWVTGRNNFRLGSEASGSAVVRLALQVFAVQLHQHGVIHIYTKRLINGGQVRFVAVGR